MSEYLKRNSWLIKDHFIPKSLVQLSRIFQESRIVYGLKPFLNLGKIIDMEQHASLKYIRSLLGLQHNVSRKRTRMAFGIPKLEHILLCRLVKNIGKYTANFEEFPTIYQNTLNEYEKWSNIKYTYGIFNPKGYKKRYINTKYNKYC
jgi:hypothetical protein